MKIVLVTQEPYQSHVITATLASLCPRLGAAPDNVRYAAMRSGSDNAGGAARWVVCGYDPGRIASRRGRQAVRRPGAATATTGDVHNRPSLPYMLHG